MADKKPIRAVFNDAGTATGLAEFQSGDTLGLTHGGIGASLSLGTAGQVLKVNSGASALEFGVVEAIVNIDNATNLTSATLVASDLFLVSDNGTEGRATLSQVDTLFKSTTQTLTNKTIDLDANTITGTLAEFNSALQSESFVGLAAQQTLTNKTINSNANTLHIDLDDLGTFTGTLTEFNSGLQGDSFTSLTGSETLTNKTLTAPTITAPTITGIVTATGAVFAGASPLVFEGATANAFETTFAITDPTADRTVTFQDATGTVAYLTDITGGGASEFSTVKVNTSVIFEGATADAHETTLAAVDPTGDRTVSLPNATDTLVGKATTDTLTNKSIDSDNNTITNIVNADIKSAAAIAFSKMADLTASRALVSDGNGDVSVSAVTSTEIGYLDGVTSAIQTQLDNKSTKAFAIAQAVALG
jgi:hypothetical protein|tara:strand:+ start:64 stop:1320 length:1257 start_codon:yes stop_codon:yes gene_type:complete